MKNRGLIIGSFAVNIILAVFIILLFSTDLLYKSDRRDDGDVYEDYSDHFYRMAEEQEWYAQNLFIGDMPLHYYDLLSTKENSRAELLLNKKPDLRNTCKRLGDRRSYKIELGELTLHVKDGKIAGVKGLHISRGTADNILVNILIYDAAISNICMVLKTLGKPKNNKERGFILDLMDRQGKIVEQFSNFKGKLSESKTEAEIVSEIDKNSKIANSLESK